MSKDKNPKPKSRDELAREELKKRRAKTIIIYGAAAHMSTGNSKLIYNMAKAFHEAGHKIYTIGFDYNSFGKVHEGWLNVLPSFHCEICGNDPNHKGSNENVQKIADYINTFRPDYFIAVGDAIMFQQFGLGKLSFENLKNCKALAYATIDSEGLFCTANLSTTKKDYIEICDKVISTSIFTQEQFKKWQNIDTSMIHEMIDLDNYKPVKAETKEKLRKEYRFKKDDFIIYSGGRNIMRKRHNIMLDAAAKFLCETKNTYLYLNIPMHTQGDQLYYPDTLNPIDFCQRVLREKYGRDLVEEGRIIFINRGGLGSKNISEAKNAELYQISDLYVTTTGGEGFGLMPVEAMACGIPAIVPDNSTGPETIGLMKESVELTDMDFRYGQVCEGGILTSTPDYQWVDYSLGQKFTTVQNTYEAIKKLHEKEELRKELGSRGRKHVEKLFNKDLFKKKWLEIINKTEKKQPKPEEQFKTVDLEGGEQDGQKP